ncbi:MAG: ImmA/IrrE family metallo-endopeptidase [Ruminococcaceae bacterium]|nr:ImmA/IrrE family metallo-endopeptidase [Oscillospiraceae bacterium]
MLLILRNGKMEINKLYNYAEESGITVDFMPLKENLAFSLDLNGKGFIALDKGLVGRTAAERVALAHELGHLATGAVYCPSDDPKTILKNEQAAHRWAINLLVPYPKLVEALKDGDEDLSTLSDRFGVTEDFMQKVLIHYSQSKSA